MITSRAAKESLYAFKEYAVRGESAPPERPGVVR
jgi:hypothetical protein